MDEQNRYVKEMEGKTVYTELHSGRRYKGKIDSVNDFHVRLVLLDKRLVVFPVSEIKFIEEEK